MGTTVSRPSEHSTRENENTIIPYKGESRADGELDRVTTMSNLDGIGHGNVGLVGCCMTGLRATSRFSRARGMAWPESSSRPWGSITPRRSPKPAASWPVCFPARRWLGSSRLRYAPSLMAASVLLSQQTTLLPCQHIFAMPSQQILALPSQQVIVLPCQHISMLPCQHISMLPSPQSSGLQNQQMIVLCCWMICQINTAREHHLLYTTVLQ